jgi:hypothetical protein
VPAAVSSYPGSPGSAEPGSDGGVIVGAGGIDGAVVRRPPVLRVAVLRAAGLRAAGLRPAGFAAAFRVPRLAGDFRVAVVAVDLRAAGFRPAVRRPRFAVLAAGAAGAALVGPARWRSTFETWVSRLAS